jgi:Predicted phosphohydrolases
MTMTPSRRRFLAQSIGALSLASAGNWAMAGPVADGDWCCPVLGDMHFDRLEHHDFAWLERDQPGDDSQVKNYSRLTRDVLPSLLTVVQQQIAAVRSPVPFVLQLGDLVEGLCGSPALANQQAREAIEFIHSAKFGRPLLMTKGNHDVTGPGAAEAYQRLLVPFMANSAFDGIEKSAFAQRRGGWLIVFYDAYDKASLNWFANLVAERRPERLLFVIHPPVVPYNARSSWHIYSKPAQQAQRNRLLELLGRHKAVVLSGHLHKYSFLRRRTEHGSFVQLAISSIATDPDPAGKPQDELSGLEAYSPDLVRLEPKRSPTTEDERRALLAAEKPFLECFEYADTWGHALLRFQTGKLTAEVHRGLSLAPWKSLDLTAHI